MTIQELNKIPQNNLFAAAINGKDVDNDFYWLTSSSITFNNGSKETQEIFLIDDCLPTMLSYKFGNNTFSIIILKNPETTDIEIENTKNIISEMLKNNQEEILENYDEYNKLVAFVNYYPETLTFETSFYWVDETETETETDDEFNDSGYDDYDRYSMEEWIEAHDEITQEVLSEALNNFEKLSEFDYDPSEYEKRLYELGEDYDVEIDLYGESDDDY